MNCLYCNTTLSFKKNFCPQCGNPTPQDSNSRLAHRFVRFLFLIILFIAGIGAAVYFYNDFWKSTELSQEPPGSSGGPICDYPLDPRPARIANETMEEMRAIHLQLEKYKQQNGAYPAGDWEEVRELIGVEGIDKLGNAYCYETCPDQNHYALISPGADRIFKRESWIMQGNFRDPNEDLFLQNGVWLRSWSPDPPLLLIHKHETVFDEK